MPRGHRDRHGAPRVDRPACLVPHRARTARVSASRSRPRHRRAAARQTAAHRHPDRPHRPRPSRRLLDGDAGSGARSSDEPGVLARSSCPRSTAIAIGSVPPAPATSSTRSGTRSSQPGVARARRHGDAARSRERARSHRICVASSASGERSPFVRITWPAIASFLNRSATVVRPLFDESRYG